MTFFVNKRCNHAFLPVKWYFAITYLRKKRSSCINILYWTWMHIWLASMAYSMFLHKKSYLFSFSSSWASYCRRGRWRVNKTECHAYLDGLGFVFYMIELNTHDWIAFPLRFCIFCNTSTTTTRASYFRMSTVFIFCYSMLFCKSN